MKEKKYYSLYLSTKKKILCGEYKSGEKLPSKRVMSDISGYSLITVENAYAMLEDEGYIVSRERSGYYVCSIDAYTTTEDIPEKILLSHLPDELPSSLPCDFEYSLWIKTLRKVISENGEKLFIKSPNKGCSTLRNALADYLYRYRGMIADPQNIIIGSGAEQLYESVVKILGREKTYGIENPSYQQIKAVYQGMGANICELSLKEDGINSRELNEKKFDVLHVTPFHSYPSGSTASISKRYEYLRWANKTQNYIVEDDFDSEFFIPGHPIESLYSLDSRNSVIYINTFSKSLSSSIRIGYMILPDSLMEEYDAKLGCFSCSVPVLEQYILAEFITSGSFERHLNRVRRKMKYTKQS